MFKRLKKQPGEEPVSEEVRKNRVQALRGFKDVLPKDAPYWDWVRGTAERVSRMYGLTRIELPHVEEEKLFVRSVGQHTDIVSKELFSFLDRDEKKVALRPEFTAGMVRAYIEHGLMSVPQPVRLTTIGSLFRYERPQAGRFREHHQWDVEVIGDAHPVLDAELMLIATRFFKELGVDVAVQINSIGTPASREKYIEALVGYFKQHRKFLSEEDKKRLVKNPLRLLDSKEPGMDELRVQAPQIVDWLDEESKQHFIRVLEYCDTLGIAYELNPCLVRGLDYYTRTVFEVYTTRTTETGDVRIALAGGGRYDGLVELLGGRPTPAVGFGLGLERIVGELKVRGVRPPMPDRPRVFIAQLGDAGRERALHLAEELRRANIPLRASFSKDGLKQQLEIANKEAVDITLIIGQKEVLDETVMVREMEGGVQEVVPKEKLLTILQKKLSEIIPVAVPAPLPEEANEEEGVVGEHPVGEEYSVELKDEDGSVSPNSPKS